MLDFGDAVARQVERTYRTPDVVAQRAEVRALLAAQQGERILDLGSGPGLLSAELAVEVGADGAVVGLDPSESMLALARARERVPGAGSLEFVTGDAFKLPFEDASFDAVVTTQVYEYVSDVPKALREARRVLRPGARLLVLDTDWDSVVWHSSDPARMARILDVWNRHLADPYLPRRLPGMLRATGFRLDRSAVIPLFNQGWDVDSFSAFIVDTVASFVIRTGISEREVSAWADDLRGLGEDAFFSLNRYVFLATAA
jgi:ubiquinone/menaquinone biosynthesis C-methylase UbiE